MKRKPMKTKEMTIDEIKQLALKLALTTVDRKKICKIIDTVHEQYHPTNGEAVELSAFMLAAALDECPMPELALQHFGQILTYLNKNMAIVVKAVDPGKENRDDVDTGTDSGS